MSTILLQINIPIVFSIGMSTLLLKISTHHTDSHVKFCTCTNQAIFVIIAGISRGQVVCCGVVLIGIFISMEPTIFNIQVAPPTHTDGPALQQGAAYWPFVYGLGWIFSAMNMVLIERAIMKIYPQVNKASLFL